MSDHGILFQPEMVRALLAGTKTQTRRLLYALRKGDFKRQMRALIDARYPPPALSLADAMEHFYERRRMYAVGDRLWVRENFRFWSAGHDCEIIFAADKVRHETGPNTGEIPDASLVAYFKMVDRAVKAKKGRNYPSIHMPRWASRLTLTVTDVRVQRLQDISEEDAIAEGAYVGKASGRVADNQMAMNLGMWFASGRGWYADLWDRINGAGSWAANPWVVAYSFTVERRNIDQGES